MTSDRIVWYRVLPNSDDFNRAFTEVSFVVQAREPDAVAARLKGDAPEIAIKNKIEELNLELIGNSLRAELPAQYSARNKSPLGGSSAMITETMGMGGPPGGGGMGGGPMGGPMVSGGMGGPPDMPGALVPGGAGAGAGAAGPGGLGGGLGGGGLGAGGAAPGGAGGAAPPRRMRPADNAGGARSGGLTLLAALAAGAALLL